MTTQEAIKRVKVIGPNAKGELVPGRTNIPAGANFGIPVKDFVPDTKPLEKPK